jgi:DegV family protein with EDD domain
MSKVAIVTDSAADIPSEVSYGKPIFSVPLNIIWDGKTYLDGLDLQPIEFYDRLRKSDTLPTTSQPSPESFKKIYMELLDKGYEILSIHLSSGLSGTFNAAHQAKNMIAGAPIELVDSLTGSIGQGLQVLNAAEAALQGATLAVCKSLAESARHRSGIYFILDTLEFLHRGGRIGGATAFLGTLLHVKPILETRNGIIDAVERARSMKKATERVIQLLQHRAGNARSIRLSVVHTNIPFEAQAFLDQVVQSFNGIEIRNAFCTYVSPVLATHTGPAGLGLAFLYD